MKTTNRQRIFFLIAGLALIFGAGWTIISRVQGGETSNAVVFTPKEGFYAPEFTLENRSGELIQLSDLKGNPVVLNFWASWCGPCRAEMPDLQNLHEKYKDEGLVILAVNSTSQDSVANADEFADRLGLTFPILYDKTGSTSNTYRVRALPTTFFIDHKGVIQEIVVGGPMSSALLQTRVINLMGEKDN